jgi:hypothetical protein
MAEPKTEIVLKKPLVRRVFQNIPHEFSFYTQIFPDSSDFLSIIQKNFFRICKEIQQLPSDQKKLTREDLGVIEILLTWLNNDLQNLILSNSEEIGREKLSYFIRKISFIRLSIRCRYGIFDTNIDHSGNCSIRLKQLQNLFEDDLEKQEEEWWAYACVIIRHAQYTGEYTLDNCKKIANVIEKINSISHKKGLALFFKDYCENIKKRINYVLFSQAVSPLIESQEESHGMYAQYCHVYIQKHVMKNKKIFQFQDNPLFEKKEFSSIKLEIDVKDSIDLPAFVCNDFAVNLGVEGEGKMSSLFCFAAHIINPGEPELKMTIPNVSSDILKKINETLESELWKEGFSNSLGMMNLTKFKKETTSKFQSLLFTVIKKHIPDALDNELHQITSDQSVLDEIKNKYSTIMEQRKLLAGFYPLQALALFNKCLISHSDGLPMTLLNPIKLAAVNCLKVANTVDSIFKSEKFSDPQKYSELFKLAKKVLGYIKEHKQSFIIHSGSPIKPGEESTLHNFYIVLKYGSNDSVQIIVVNAGSGCSKHNKRYQHQAENDVNQYHYFAFKPMIINEENCENLSHYVYSLFRLHHFKADPNSSSQYSFDNLLKDVYLRPADNECQKPYFEGCEFKKITGFEQIDLPESFMAQIAGNCVIYNFKLALEVMFNLDKIQFGQLVDTLMLGLDQLIIQIFPHYEQFDLNDSSSKSSYSDTEEESFEENSPNVKNCTLVSTRNLQDQLAPNQASNKQGESEIEIAKENSLQDLAPIDQANRLVVQATNDKILQIGVQNSLTQQGLFFPCTPINTTHGEFTSLPTQPTPSSTNNG